MTLLLVLLGALPFLAGWALDLLMHHLAVFPPLEPVGLLFLLLWGGFAFLLRGQHFGLRRIILSLHGIPALVLVLLAIQELVLHAYWFNPLGLWTQRFYLPVLNLGFALTSWSHTVFSAYCAGFLLMLLAATSGCALRGRLRR